MVTVVIFALLIRNNIVEQKLLRSFKLTMFLCCAPTNDLEEADTGRFYKTLNRYISYVPKQDLFSVVGHMNVNVRNTNERVSNVKWIHSIGTLS